MNRLRDRQVTQQAVLVEYDQALAELEAREAELIELRQRPTLLLAALGSVLNDDEATAEIAGTDIKTVKAARREAPSDRVQQVVARHRPSSSHGD